ncbi:SLC13 family permease [Nocardioides fonticola]|uniref:SLC13 family permease n=1 Tax=Nocardioides fonticola TaxID=450363 RepID=UPI0031E25A73
MSTLLRETVAVAALLALLVTAWRHLGPRGEAAAALLTSAAVLAVGAVSPSDAGDALERLAPVVLFLAAVLVVADVCGRAGLFTVAATRVARFAGDSPVRLLVGVAVLATVVTTVLSLDATVVLLTPVVVAAALRRSASPAPGAWLCLRLANSASLLLPVANLTNLLAVPDLDVGFLGFARLMAPALVVVVAAEWACARVQFRRELRPAATAATAAAVGTTPAPDPEATAEEVPLARLPLVVVALMLAGFAIGSPLGVEPGWIAAAAAVVLAVWAGRRGLLVVPDVVRAAQPSFALYVLGLGVVVAAVATSGPGDAVRHLVDAVVAGADPAAPGLLTLLGVAAVATLVANLVTNLSATLLVVPLVAPLGDTAILAALIGLDAGAGLTYSGSLANLLWRRTLDGTAAATGLAAFHRRSLVATPIVVALAVATLWATARVLG